MGNGSENVLTGADWRMEWGPEASLARFLFRDVALELDGVSLGDSPESRFLDDGVRFHGYMDVEGNRVESARRAGFAGAARVRRKAEIFQNRCLVATEIHPGKGPGPRSLSVDSMFLRGRWRELMIGTAPGGGIDATSPRIERLNLADVGTVVWKSSVPWLFCVASDDDVALEVGVGDDLWRWKAAATLGLKSRFRIEKRDEGLLLSRDVFLVPDDVEPPRREWRFKWYFAWMGLERLNGPVASFADDPAVPLPGPKECFAHDRTRLLLPRNGWKTVSMARNGESVSERPCLQAPQVARHLRRWVRSMAENPPGPLISLEGVSPRYCDSASHLARGKKKRLPHWNVHGLLDFHFWANRLLRKKGTALRIETTTELINLLPSMKGMSDYETAPDSDASQRQID